jgi:hypothetical protein
MKVLKKGITPNGIPIQIEEWQENYSFLPYGGTLVSYPKSKMSHEGAFSPKGNEVYRFQFDFKSEEETETAFNDLLTGNKILSDFRKNMYNPKYADCI